MPILWGIHNDEPSVDLINGGFVSVGWDEMGDLRQYAGDKEALKKRLIELYPEAKPGTIPVWAGVLRRFSMDMAVGDYVVSPTKVDRTLKFGRITGPYYYQSDAELHRSRLPVEWIQVEVPRDIFTKNARYEIGSAVTLFKVKRHAQEFLRFIGQGSAGAVEESANQSEDHEVEVLEDEPSAERIETYTRDFAIEVLHKLDPYQFEGFVAALLRAMGYRASVTQASGDGGVDVIAFRDALGLEPPIIKVQCKRTLGTIGGPDIQKLIGALAQGGSEVGLFVTLGSYSSDALHIERTRQDLRLFNGNDLVTSLFEHYDKISPEWQQVVPMRQVYVVDRGPTSA